jgi:hypothetical protein
MGARGACLALARVGPHRGARAPGSRRAGRDRGRRLACLRLPLAGRALRDAPPALGSAGRRGAEQRGLRYARLVRPAGPVSPPAFRSPSACPSTRSRSPAAASRSGAPAATAARARDRPTSS